MSVIPESIDFLLYKSLIEWKDWFDVRVFCKKNNVSRERVLEGFDKLEKLKLISFQRGKDGKYLRRNFKVLIVPPE